MKSLVLFVSLLSSAWAHATPTAEQPDRNIAAYNLESNQIGLKGYDPISYFEQGGKKPSAGKPQFSTTYGGVTYHFANEANRAIFLNDPTRFEPTYGGWCAWAMANQSYADINPEIYTLHGNRLHLFISQGAKARFDQRLVQLESQADTFWKSESGENPRL